MAVGVKGKLLRLFVGEADRVDGVPVYEKVFSLSKELGLMGATVLRGIESRGGKGEIHSAKILSLASDLPVVVEIVGESSAIDALASEVDSLMERTACGGLVTLLDIEMRKYRGE